MVYTAPFQKGVWRRIQIVDNSRWRPVLKPCFKRFSNVTQEWCDSAFTYQLWQTLCLCIIQYSFLCRIWFRHKSLKGKVGIYWRPVVSKLEEILVIVWPISVHRQAEAQRNYVTWLGHGVTQSWTQTIDLTFDDV